MPDRLHPYCATAEEVMAQYDLTRIQQKQVWDKLATMGCPFFSVTVYARTHHACAAKLNP